MGGDARLRDARDAHEVGDAELAIRQERAEPNATLIAQHRQRLDRLLEAQCILLSGCTDSVPGSGMSTTPSESRVDPEGHLLSKLDELSSKLRPLTTW